VRFTTGGGVGAGAGVGRGPKSRWKKLRESPDFWGCGVSALSGAGLIVSP